jgi:tRNA nucleotidyltransferase/poly(A) polymerase
VLSELQKGNIPRKLFLIPKVFLRDMDAMGEVLALPDMNHDKAVRAAIYKGGRTATAQALMIELVQDRVMNGYAPRALEIIQNWDVPDCPVNGQALIEAGFKPGPALGVALSGLEERWIASDFKLSKEELLTALSGV